MMTFATWDSLREPLSSGKPGASAGSQFAGARSATSTEVERWQRKGRFKGVIFREKLLMEEILHQLRLVVYPIMYRVFYIPGGCLGFLNHQQKDKLYLYLVYE